METPAIAHLVGAYFHQDWADEFDADPDAAVDAFVAGTPDLAPQLPAEVQLVLRELGDEGEVKNLLDSLGSNLTTLPGETYRGWLTHVARRVEGATST